MARPAVLVCLDGMDPAYVEAALEAGLWPRLRAWVGAGGLTFADAALPTFTNTNNLSLVTGRAADGHGICGNHFFDREAGREAALEDPRYLRADSILARLEREGARVAVVTAKEKLRRLLAAGRERGPSFSAERAAEQSFAPWAIDRFDQFVRRPMPAIYSADASIFVLEAGVALLEKGAPDVLYLSTTDFLQHAHAPGAPELEPFLRAVDRTLGALADAGAAVVATADHGMNAKPRVVWLGEALPGARVTLPITDPYVRHHGALGGCAFVDHEDPARALETIRALEGVEAALPRAEAARAWSLPEDRIGDVVVFSRADAALGRTPAEHDLAALAGPLRSHGGLAERRVPVLTNVPLPPIHETRNLLEALLCAVS